LIALAAKRGLFYDMFFTFLEQGFHHIIDFNGLDHLLFLSALVVMYTVKDWKKILAICTAFTIAHSITLFLCIYDIIFFDAKTIEILIAISIFYTCIENLYLKSFQKYRVVVVFFFGLIHGMGFSRLLKELFGGMDFNPWNTLLAFNIGIELAQIVIVTLLLAMIHYLIKLTKLKQEYIVKFVSIIIAVQSLFWIYQRII
jgi:hypothetical protein